MFHPSFAVVSKVDKFLTIPLVSDTIDQQDIIDTARSWAEYEVGGKNCHIISDVTATPPVNIGGICLHVSSGNCVDVYKVAGIDYGWLRSSVTKTLVKIGSFYVQPVGNVRIRGAPQEQPQKQVQRPPRSEPAKVESFDSVLNEIKSFDKSRLRSCKRRRLLTDNEINLMV